MTFSPKDTRDVAKLVAKKLELYLNVERRENEFDTQGHHKTTHKMQMLDWMYRVLEKTELDSPRSMGESQGTRKAKIQTKDDRSRNTGNPTQEQQTELKSTDDCSTYSDEEKHIAGSNDSSKLSQQPDKQTKKVMPKVIQNSRRVVTNREAERLSENASTILCDQPLDKLQVIHRYRPNSCDIPPIVENGRVQNYSLHVGSALHAKNYVDFYMREGLQTGKKEHSKRLQRLKKQKQEKTEETSKSSSSLSPSSVDKV